MRYLVPALVTEGKSDDRFLSPLLQRTLVAMCQESLTDLVEVAPTLVLRPAPGPASVPDIVAKATGSGVSGKLDFDLLFFHRDGGSNLERTQREWIDPMAEAWAPYEEVVPLVPVVPIRETEAWMFADIVALRSVLGVNWQAQEFGVPASPKHVEQIVDPKVALRQIIMRLPARAGGRRIRTPEDFYVGLGERVSVSVLQRVPAFESMWKGLLASLEQIGYRRG